jgi:RHS repeat-associated protein
MKETATSVQSFMRSHVLLRLLGLVLFLQLGLPWKSYGQNGEGMWDAIDGGEFGPCGGSTGFTDYRNNYYYNGIYYYDYYGQPSTDVWYSFTVSDYTDIQLSLCGSNFDTYISLLDVYGNEVMSNDNSSSCWQNAELTAYSLSPGMYYVVVEGSWYDYGDYVLNISPLSSGGGSIIGANASVAIDLGTYGIAGGNNSNTQDNSLSCYGDDYGQPNNDIYYKFTLSGTSRVRLDHCGSYFDTYMYLLNSSGQAISSSDDGSSCNMVGPYIEITLGAGTYYIVSEGSGYHTGYITTNIEVDPLSIVYPSGPHVIQAGVSMSPIVPTITGSLPVFNTQSTSTYAGTGLYGSYNGQSNVSSFYYPCYTTFDASGNMYVADFYNHKVRKISPSGVVSTLAGSGIAGYQDGAGSTARFVYPSGVAVDASGNVYVTDRDNHRIRKITPSGVVSTLAGSGSIGSANGTGTAASFNTPTGLTIDQSGNLYVSDYSNHRIRKITPSGVVSTYAGTGSMGFSNGSALSATFRRPHGLTMDSQGNLYVADRDNYAIRKISNTGVVSTIAGDGTSGYANGIGTAARFGWPNAVAIDGSGNLYVADQTNHMIRKITPAGEVSTYGGNQTPGYLNGTNPDVRFNNPYGVSTDSKGNVYVADYFNHVIRKMSSSPFTVTPELPAGLSINASTGAISGTPTAISAATQYTISGYGTAPSTFTLSVGAGGGISPSQDQNYILTLTPRIAGYTTAAAVYAGTSDANQVMAEVQYFDGLGRPMQTVQVKGSANADKDIVVPIAYDQYGRENRKYLPYASTSNNGSYKTNPLTSQQSYYQSPPAGVVQTPNPYAETIFEASPLNRVLEQGAPGAAWQPVANSNTGHTQKMVYSSNAANEVRLYNAEAVTTVGETYKRTLTGTGYYGANQLYKTISKDENWSPSQSFPQAGTVEEYKDKEGRVVLKRTFNEKNNSLETLSTYYVYDDLGNLSFVLPPGSNPDATSVPSQTTLDNYCYQYRYDGRRRLVEKKLPGKGWEYMVYNKLDQLVLSQDTIQRAANQWLFSKYDGLGRLVITGLYNDSASRTSLQSTVDAEPANSYPLWEQRAATGIGYSNSSFPRTIAYYHQINYYDDYNFPGNSFGGASGTQSNQTKSLLTGSKTTILGTGDMLLSVNYYDAKGRVIQSKSANHLGGMDVVDNTYNFTNELTSSIRSHTAYSNTTTIATNYDYDHVGRKLQARQSINGATEVILSKHTYNEIGQLKDKEVHSTNGSPFLNKTSYTYNPRGWLKSQTNTGVSFNMTLSYEDGSTPQYNGNIANQSFANSSSNTFTYQYDKLNRLLSATATGMSEELSYDVMGNITSLNRDGTGAKTYNYSANQLQSVTGVTATNYIYDANGNAITDGRNNKTISYNYLNLPQTVSGGLSYTYDATGQKLTKNNNGTLRHYLQGIEYQGTTIDIIQTEEGIARHNGNNAYSYEYNLTDHLGNVRVGFYKNPSTNNLDILQRDDYYAFGKRKVVQGGTNKYLYNGKELQEELGEQYDYGARFYDPVIGRWNVIDAKSEKYYNYSPYNYAINNPIVYIDPDGNDIIFVVRGQDGQKDRMLTYRGGNAYWNDTGKKYEGSGANNTIWRVLKAYQTIEKSDDVILKNQLHTLEKSEHSHFIEASPNGDNAVQAYGIPDEKGGVGTQTEFDFSKKNKAEFEKSEGIKDSDLSTVAHEMRHQYDRNNGNMKDNHKSNTAKDPSEIRAVANENRARKLEGLPARTTYGGEKIDPEKLKNPPNY